MLLYSVYYISVGSSTCFWVLTPIIRSSYSCNYSSWYWLTGSTNIHSRCWVGTDSIPEALITAVPAPDDGCQHPKHVEQKQISPSDNHPNWMAECLTYILKNINSKLEKENAMVAKVDRVKPASSYTLANTTKKTTTSLMRTTFKNFRKIPRTNTKNLSPRPYNIETLSSIRNKRSTSPRRNPNPPN